ncbi:cyclic nucleotide-binding domain-containing protein [Marixanthomonas spongiae]|uniref:Cyclic nucleotide-binding domain-containing protein n=1 Tax=Marixanthomonas spongiae TaxID=2174845 RepID=A0A2U0I0Z4_9FLAO|nr:cyclic nucleotide-binding domain-containing protein [Marixanthomonas spongiae]PVW14775.1 hypothetical protein DDV96_09680 [Marixanthomonas spongiae]
MQTSESLNAKPSKSENSLESFLEDIFFLNSEAIEELKESFSSLFFKKGAVILTPNAIENELKFVVKGYIREYISSNGKETNINFYGPNDFTTNFLSFTTGKKVITWQECM